MTRSKHGLYRFHYYVSFNFTGYGQTLDIIAFKNFPPRHMRYEFLDISCRIQMFIFCLRSYFL